MRPTRQLTTEATVTAAPAFDTGSLLLPTKYRNLAPIGPPTPLCQPSSATRTYERPIPPTRAEPTPLRRR